MTNSFKQFEKDAWEEKASRYNDTWGTVTSQPIDTILEIASEVNGRQLLDIGCGPGHLCGKAKLIGFEVTGADYSDAMIKIASGNYPDVRFQREDAENLSFKDSSFDVVVLNYLLLHVSDQQKTLLEAKRVLKPGGKIIFSNWVPPQNSPGLGLIFGALKEFADMSVIPPAQDIFMFSNSEYAEKFFLDNGFSRVSCQIFPTVWKVPDGESFFKAVQAGTRMGGLVDLQKPEIKEKIRTKIAAEIQNFKRDGGFIVPTPTLIVSALLDP